VNEDPALQLRINQLFDRIESTLKQSLRFAETQTNRKLEPEAQANLLLCYVIGRWHQFAKSGFKRKPMELVQPQLTLLYGLEE
jgi:TetR/AcrR family transcriptional regulator